MSGAIQEAIGRLSAQGIHSVLAQFTDLHGSPKGKLVPLALQGEWVHTGAGFAGPSIWGTGLPRHGARSEYFGRVVLDSLRPLPFMPGVAHAVCDGFAGGEPLDTCPRQVLKRQLARMGSTRSTTGLTRPWPRPTAFSCSRYRPMRWPSVMAWCTAACPSPWPVRPAAACIST